MRRRSGNSRAINSATTRTASAACAIVLGYICEAGTSCVAAPPNTCGNGVLDPGEECDDENSNSSDGCTNLCTICGNGIVSPGEECDDGNLVDGDGCSAACEIEPAWTCTGQPSVCTPMPPPTPTCGDGVVDPGEQCDDGNTVDGDGCSKSCTFEVLTTGVCGNGVVEPGEECDDGNTDPTDGCTNACTICGNGIVSPGEQCDDGNLVDGDGCASDCTYTLIPGNSSPFTDRRACGLEWALITSNPLALDARGRPSSTQSCQDNDPACDFDPTPGVCEFHVVACLNNIDPNLPSCPPRGVSKVLARKTLAAANYTSFTTALADLRDPITGTTGMTLPLSPAQTDVCTAPFPVQVPLVNLDSQAGRAVVRTVTVASAPPLRSDAEMLTLVCTP